MIIDVNKVLLRREYERLSRCLTLKDCSDMLDVYSECLFMFMVDFIKEGTTPEEIQDANILLQMMLTKVRYIKRMSQGISFKAKNGSYLHNIIDPTIVTSLVRNIYETVAVFNLIYISPKSEDEKRILYLLWVHAGLKYRQRFESIVFAKEDLDKLKTGEVNVEKLLASIKDKLETMNLKEADIEEMIALKKEDWEKLQTEQADMDNIVISIKNNPLFKTLDEKNQGKLLTLLKQKDFLMKFEGHQVIFLSYNDLTKTMGIQENLMDNLYTYFSFHAHPTNVAVFQFRDMFNKEDPAFIKVTLGNMKTAFLLLSIFIADYIKLFPNAINIFKKLETRDQIVIDFYNTIARGLDCHINDAYKALG